MYTQPSPCSVLYDKNASGVKPAVHFCQEASENELVHEDSENEVVQAEAGPVKKCVPVSRTCMSGSPLRQDDAADNFAADLEAMLEQEAQSKPEAGQSCKACFQRQ